MYENTLLLGTGSNGFHFNTRDTGAAPITLAGTPSLAVSVNSAAPATAGLTLTVDDQSITGYHLVEIDVDDATLALADGDVVEIYIAAGTVDSVSVVGTLIAQLSISNGSLQAQTKTDILDAFTSDATKLGGANLNTLAGHDPGATIAKAGDAMALTAAYDAAKTAASATALSALTGTIATLDALLAKVKRYFMLALRKDAAIATDAATELGELNADLGSGAGAYDQTSDSQQAIRDEGDAAWTTGSGGGTGLTAAETAAAVLDALLADHTVAGSVGERVGRVPNADAAAAGGLPTVDANNRIVGIQGSKNTFDALFTALNNPTAAAIATAVLTAVMSEGYPVKGAAPTLENATQAILAMMGRFSVVGTTMTVYKEDGVTPAMTFTLDDPTNPTSIQRTT